MFELPIGEPTPTMGQSKVKAQLIERCVGGGQAFPAGVAAAGLRMIEFFGSIEGGAQQPGGNRVAVKAREALAFRD